MNPIALVTIIDSDTGVVLSSEKAIPIQVDYSYMNTSDLDVKRYQLNFDWYYSSDYSTTFSYLESNNGRQTE